MFQPGWHSFSFHPVLGMPLRNPIILESFEMSFILFVSTIMVIQGRNDDKGQSPYLLKV